MAGTAKVDSIEPLKALRRTLFKFAEACNTALADAESEISRTHMWITTEQTTFWQMQIRKRTEMVARCADALRMKKLYKDSAGRTSSAIDEQKALDAAKRALEIAHQKSANCKTSARKLEREVQNYRGSVQRFATTVQSDLPVAAAKLNAAIIKLEQYVALRAPGEVGSTTDSMTTGSVNELTQPTEAEHQSMARPADDDASDHAPAEKKEGD